MKLHFRFLASISKTVAGFFITLLVSFSMQLAHVFLKFLKNITKPSAADVSSLAVSDFFSIWLNGITDN